MYGIEITDSMFAAMSETYRRRAIQEVNNKKHNIGPQTIKKDNTSKYGIKNRRSCFNNK